MKSEDTIAAISTATGEAGIGIVRISGPEAIETASRIFARRPASPPDGSLEDLPSHRIVHGYIVEPETHSTLDEVLISIMRAPRTYTREDVVEINGHGGPIPLSRILELVTNSGARLAEPGEFTKRAFLAGRIDLAQAEAVMDVIQARTTAAEKMAMGQLEGGLTKKLEVLGTSLLELCARIETHLDFPEEEIEHETEKGIEEGLVKLGADLASLARTHDQGRLYREGLKVAIIGRPNVGKSSLLNALLLRDRAIVTEMPGTTRDVIEETINLEGLPMVIMDTAGIRQSHDMAEEEGVRRSLRAAEEADLLLAVLDGSQELHPEDHRVLEAAEKAACLIIINKTDLPGKLDLSGNHQNEIVELSARTGEGIEALKSSIRKLAIGSTTLGTEHEGIIITNLRHRRALETAAEKVGEALQALKTDSPLEIPALELREAREALGLITGETITEDDILNHIFSSFCIGK